MTNAKSQRIAPYQKALMEKLITRQEYEAFLDAIDAEMKAQFEAWNSRPGKWLDILTKKAGR